MSLLSPEQKNLTGILNNKDAFVIIVKTEWNATYINALEEGCIKILDLYNIRHETIVVPGAFEITFAIKQKWELSRNGAKPSAFIALGCVLRGDTPHFDYVCKAVTDGILQLNLQLSAPTIFGILTVDTEEQIKERIGGKHGHKGEEAAITAIKMMQLSESFSIQ